MVVTYDAVYDALEDHSHRTSEPRMREEAVSNHHILSFSTSASAAGPATAVGVAELDSIESVDGIFRGIERSSMRRLQQYRWPGNIRQLQNVIEQSAVLADGGELEVSDSALGAPRSSARKADAVDGIFAENPTLEEIKKRYISHLLTTTRGNMLRAAAILDVDRRSLYRMVARYQLGSPSLHRRTTASQCDDSSSFSRQELEA
jgi:hypothetical protein